VSELVTGDAPFAVVPLAALVVVDLDLVGLAGE
jgi:hypothetical protein